MISSENLVTGQIGVLSVFPFVVLFMALVSELKNGFVDSKKGFLILFFVIPFLFFAVPVCKKEWRPIGPHRHISAALFWSPFFGKPQTAAGKRLSQLFMVASTGISCLALIIIMAHIQKPFLPLSPSMDPTSQIRGWKQWAVDIHSLQEKIDPTLSMPVCANRYQEAALLGFYMPNHPRGVSLNIGSRENNYSIADSKKYLVMKNLLFIYPTQDTLLPPVIAAHFERTTLVGAVFLWQDRRSNNPYRVFNAVLKKEP